jgi:hypothetical protein
MSFYDAAMRYHQPGGTARERQVAQPDHRTLLDHQRRAPAMPTDAGAGDQLDLYTEEGTPRCEPRIHELRTEVERAVDTAAPDADAALDLARGMDDLERVQPRIDARLRAYVAALVDERTPETFGEEPA